MLKSAGDDFRWLRVETGALKDDAERCPWIDDFRANSIPKDIFHQLYPKD